MRTYGADGEPLRDSILERAAEVIRDATSVIKATNAHDEPTNPLTPYGHAFIIATALYSAGLLTTDESK